MMLAVTVLVIVCFGILILIGAIHFLRVILTDTHTDKKENE